LPHDHLLLIERWRIIVASFLNLSRHKLFSFSMFLEAKFEIEKLEKSTGLTTLWGLILAGGFEQ
jgi:hypothetical protein